MLLIIVPLAMITYFAGAFCTAHVLDRLLQMRGDHYDDDVDFICPALWPMILPVLLWEFADAKKHQRRKTTNEKADLTLLRKYRAEQALESWKGGACDG